MTATTATPVQVDQLIDMFTVMKDNSTGWLYVAEGTPRPTTIALMNEWSVRFGQIDKMLQAKTPELYTMREKTAVAQVFCALLAVTGAIGLRLADTGVIDPDDIR